MTHVVISRAALLSALCVATLAGCKATPPTQRTPVDLLLRASAARVAPATAIAPSLTIDYVRLSVSEASLGRVQQFGCIDCQGESALPSLPASILLVPLGSVPVLVVTEQASPGSYTDVELSLAPPGTDAVRRTTDWTTGASLEISGSYNGKAFRLPMAITGRFVEHLASPVVVTSASADGTKVGVTISLPVASWFTASGSVLDPGTVAGRAAIEANARASFIPMQESTGGREQ
jgi:hypothetical protein